MSVKKSQLEKDYNRQKIYFETISIYYLCSELLEMAQIPENPYLLHSLQKKYEQVQSESKDGLLFSFKELFSEGWIQGTEEEWLWNNSQYEYESLTSYCYQREKQIVKFLQSMKLWC